MKKLVVLLSGKLKSGKNQIATYFKNEFEKEDVIIKDESYIISEKRPLIVTEDFFAKKLKEDCVQDFKPLFDFIRTTLSDFKEKCYSYDYYTSSIETSFEALRIPDEDKMFEDKTPIVRKMFQLYGTEVFRNRVDSDWWVKALRKKVEESTSDVILITDCRFPNEIEGMYSPDFDTVTIRLTRDINTDNVSRNHPSETSLDNWDQWTYIIDNHDGDLVDLNDSVKLIVRELLNKDEKIGLLTRLSKEELKNLNKLIDKDLLKRLSLTN